MRQSAQTWGRVWAGLGGLACAALLCSAFLEAPWMAGTLALLMGAGTAWAVWATRRMAQIVNRISHQIILRMDWSSEVFTHDTNQMIR